MEASEYPGFYLLVASSACDNSLMCELTHLEAWAPGAKKGHICSSCKYPPSQRRDTRLETLVR